MKKLTALLIAGALVATPAAVFAQGGGGGGDNPGAGSTKEQSKGPNAPGGAGTSSQNPTEKDKK